MRFRTISVADSVVERILAVADAISSGANVPREVVSDAPLPVVEEELISIAVSSEPVDQASAEAEFQTQRTAEGGQLPGGDIPGLPVGEGGGQASSGLPGLDESGLDIGTILSGGDSIDAILGSQSGI